MAMLNLKCKEDVQPINPVVEQFSENYTFFVLNGNNGMHSRIKKSKTTYIFCLSNREGCAK